MSLALKLVLAPVLVAQAVATRRRAPVLPEAEGPRAGLVGEGPDALRVLIAGDSSAAGVGVAHQDQALAGHLSRALHRDAARPVRWALHAQTGLTTRQVFALLRDASPPPADVAVVVTGVNDVIDLVPVRRALQQRAALADWLLAEGRAAHVVFAPLPPVHRFPLLPQPLKRVMGDDARRHDDALARWAATRGDVSHTPIHFDLGVEDMAADGFHPGEPVYRACGEALAAHVAALMGSGAR
jgi:lysophospholipase L1-like esterase